MLIVASNHSPIATIIQLHIFKSQQIENVVSITKWIVTANRNGLIGVDMNCGI